MLGPQARGAHSTNFPQISNIMLGSASIKVLQRTQHMRRCGDLVHFLTQKRNWSGDLTMLLEESSPFQDEEAAYRYVENHVWPDGAVCPRCGSARRTSRLSGKSTRIGTYKCYECRKPFTVKIGTIFQQSHLPMHIWLKAIFLLSSARQDIDIERLRRVLEITPRSAASMARRIRYWLQATTTYRGGS